MDIQVERPPDCPECGAELSFMDEYVVSWQFRCPQCKRAFQVKNRDRREGWEKVDSMFIYPNARPPEPGPQIEKFWEVLPSGYEEF